MLIYADKIQTIAVSRPQAAGSEAQPVHIASINKRDFSVQLEAKAAPTTEEIREVEATATGFKWADDVRKEAVLRFPVSARRAARFYVSTTSDVDKQLIGAAARRAARIVKKNTPRPSDDAKTTNQAVPQAAPSPAGWSPEMVAQALFKALSTNSSGKVKGEPSSGKRTEIRGFWDLNDVARRLLSSS